MKKDVIVIKARYRIVNPNYQFLVFCFNIIKSRYEIAERY